MCARLSFALFALLEEEVLPKKYNVLLYWQNLSNFLYFYYIFTSNILLYFEFNYIRQLSDPTDVFLSCELSKACRCKSFYFLKISNLFFVRTVYNVLENIRINN